MIVSTAPPADELDPPGEGWEGCGALCGTGASIGEWVRVGKATLRGACVFTYSETWQTGHDHWEDEDGEDEHKPVADPDQDPLPWELKAEGAPAITLSLVVLELIQDPHHGQEDPKTPRDSGNEDQAGGGSDGDCGRRQRRRRRLRRRRRGWSRRRGWRSRRRRGPRRRRIVNMHIPPPNVMRLRARHKREQEKFVHLILCWDKR